MFFLISAATNKQILTHTPPSIDVQRAGRQALHEDQNHHDAQPRDPPRLPRPPHRRAHRVRMLPDRVRGPDRAAVRLMGASPIARAVRRVLHAVLGAGTDFLLGYVEKYVGKQGKHNLFAFALCINSFLSFSFRKSFPRLFLVLYSAQCYQHMRIQPTFPPFTHLCSSIFICVSHFSSQIIANVKARYPSTPLIFHANGGTGKLDLIKSSKADVIGIDWATDMAQARSLFGAGTTIQGNVDPMILFGTEEVIRREVNKCIVAGGKNRFILNVGHGVAQGTPEENVGLMVRCAHESAALFKQPVGAGAAKH